MFEFAFMQRALVAALIIGVVCGLLGFFVILRKLAFIGETLQSHYLHAFYLVAPDLLGVTSVLPLVKSHPDVVIMALRLKRMANDICGAVAGRHIHPCAMKVKAFPKVPLAARTFPASSSRNTGSGQPAQKRRARLHSSDHRGVGRAWAWSALPETAS